MIQLLKEDRYTYGYDEYSLYCAEAVSNKMIKIEKWEKALSTSRNFSYEYDVGVYQVDENQFGWMDNEKTTFLFQLKDGKEWGLRKGENVYFTILVPDTDKDKGTNWTKEKTIYCYKNDDWHLYKAIPLTEELLKIECWYRAMAIGDFGYGYDVSVVSITKNESNFNWTDEEHTSFTIELKDTKNSGLKKAEIVLFELE